MAAVGVGRRHISRRAWTQSDNWETVRQRLLQRRICDFGLRIKGSPLEPFLRQLERELSAKGIDYQPTFYLTDVWGCPDQVPAIGIPFYLASPLLARIEKERTGDLEDSETIMQLLRHETGHAINYAFRLWEAPRWRELFGPFSKPYREVFHPNPWSRSFVRHIRSRFYGYTYAQKHPDDDFAETFAVWLTPRSGWRRKYRAWPAIQKLRYIDHLMRRIAECEPKCKGGKLVEPVRELTMPLAEYYRRRSREYGRTG
ncbi:MAG: hypothetical protein FJ280_24140 [Planctomycetes bacterium]|nr:hypothetical protein [Planctomycetota bacterium]